MTPLLGARLLPAACSARSAQIEPGRPSFACKESLNTLFGSEHLGENCESMLLRPSSVYSLQLHVHTFLIFYASNVETILHWRRKVKVQLGPASVSLVAASPCGSKKCCLGVLVQNDDWHGGTSADQKETPKWYNFTSNDLERVHTCKHAHK